MTILKLCQGSDCFARPYQVTLRAANLYSSQKYPGSTAIGYVLPCRLCCALGNEYRPHKDYRSAAGEDVRLRFRELDVAQALKSP